MNIKKPLLVAVLLPLNLIISNITHAATVSIFNVAETQLLGFDGIALLGDTWNVRFVDGSAESIFGNGLGGFDYSFSNFSDASLAANALLDAMVTHTPQAISTPFFINGVEIAFAQIWTTYTPFNQLFTEGVVFELGNGNISFPFSVPFQATPNEDFSLSSNQVYTHWTNVSTVPVPAAVWLMGSGLLGLVGYSRKRSQVAA